MGGNNSKIYKSPHENVHIPKASIPDFVLPAWERNPEKTAAVVGSDSITYAELAKQSRRFASAITTKFGFGKGDVLAILAPNGIEWIVAFYGAILAGGVVTTINPAYTQEEVSHQFEDSEPKLIVTAKASEPIAIGASTKSVEQVIVIAPKGSSIADGSVLFAGLVEEGSADFQGPKMSHKDLAVLPYSSGTTGAPKGVMLTHYNLIANACQNNVVLKEEFAVENPSLVAFLPFFHIYAMQVFLLGALYNGAKLCIMPKFDAKEFLGILVNHKVTTAFVVPPIVNFMAKHPAMEAALPGIRPHLKTVLSGAAPLGKELGAALVARLDNGCKIKQGYGMTELSPVTHVTPEEHATAENSGCAGVLVPNTMMKIVKENGELAGPGELGDIYIKGPQVMRGYLKNPKATKDMIKGAWLMTGDVGFIDDKGLTTIVDRSKELIKVKALQVAPAEVEAVLHACPGVSDVAVIGIQDDRCGEVPKAFIVPTDEKAPPTLEDIQKFAKLNLAEYKIPQALEVISAIPKSASGKILRRNLRRSTVHEA